MARMSFSHIQKRPRSVLCVIRELGSMNHSDDSWLEAGDRCGRGHHPATPAVSAPCVLHTTHGCGPRRTGVLREVWWRPSSSRARGVLPATVVNLGRGGSSALEWRDLSWYQAEVFFPWKVLSKSQEGPKIGPHFPKADSPVVFVPRASSAVLRFGVVASTLLLPRWAGPCLALHRPWPSKKTPGAAGTAFLRLRGERTVMCYIASCLNIFSAIKTITHQNQPST